MLLLGNYIKLSQTKFNRETILHDSIQGVLENEVKRFIKYE